MELRQTETLGIFDHHNGGIRDIDSDLDDRGGYQHMNLICRKCFHDRIFFFSLHLSVQIFHPDRRGQGAAQLFGIIDDVLCLQHLARLDHRADDVCLTAGTDFIFDEAVGIRAKFTVHDTVLDRLPVCRKFIDDGNIKIPI